MWLRIVTGGMMSSMLQKMSLDTLFNFLAVASSSLSSSKIAL
jgi:hypothetical protein